MLLLAHWLLKGIPLYLSMVLIDCGKSSHDNKLGAPDRMFQRLRVKQVCLHNLELIKQVHVGILKSLKFICVTLVSHRATNSESTVHEEC